MSSENCQTSLHDCCESRGFDEKWVKKVLPNILYAKDFPAKDVLYHKQCSTNFRIGKSMPRKISSSDVNEASNIGRPKNQQKLEAFQMVIDEFYENDDETTTISDLEDKMKSIIDEPYDRRSVIRELNKKEDIIITQIGKEKNIVTTKTCASKVLDNFHKKNNSGMSETELKKEIIQTAASLIKSEIDDKLEDRSYYPDISSISDIEKQLNYVPFLLRYFLGNIFKKRKTDMQTTIAALGQAIMQQQRPRGLMAPMQFALTMRVHDDCPGLVNDLFKSGFCLSEDEAKLFKASAAMDHPNPFASMQGKFGWIIGDNFDHNKITLTGHDTIHVMGLMMTETPSAIPPHRIKRLGRDILNQKPKDMIPIKYIKQINSSNKIIYKISSDILVEDSREHLDMLWKISLAYKEEKMDGNDT